MMRKVVIAATVSIAFYAILHVLGLRADAGFLSGAPVSSEAGGMLYVLSYFVAIVVAPIVLIACALDAIAARIIR